MGTASQPLSDPCPLMLLASCHLPAQGTISLWPGESPFAHHHPLQTILHWFRHLETSSGLKKKKKSHIHQPYLAEFKKRGSSILPKSRPSKYFQYPFFSSFPGNFTSCSLQRSFCLSHFLPNSSPALPCPMVKLAFSGLSF